MNKNTAFTVNLCRITLLWVSHIMTHWRPHSSWYQHISHLVKNTNTANIKPKTQPFLEVTFFQNANSGLCISLPEQHRFERLSGGCLTSCVLWGSGPSRPSDRQPRSQLTLRWQGSRRETRAKAERSDRNLRKGNAMLHRAASNVSDKAKGGKPKVRALVSLWTRHLHMGAVFQFNCTSKKHLKRKM